MARIRKERRNDQKGRRDSHLPPQLSAVQIDRVPDDIRFFVNLSMLCVIYLNTHLGIVPNCTSTHSPHSASQAH